MTGPGTGYGTAVGREPGGRGPAYVSVELPFDTTVASVARKEVVSLLGDSEDVTESVSLVCSELVTNAYRHGSPPILLDVRLDPHEAEPAVEITVTDGGAPCRPDPDRELELLDESGRGHLLVDALAVGSSLEVGSSGTRAWCRLLIATRTDSPPSPYPTPRRSPAMRAEPVSTLPPSPASGTSNPAQPAGVRTPRVLVALHEGFYGASSGSGFSNRAFLEALALTLPPGRLLVLPTHVPHSDPAYDQRWTLHTQRLLDSVEAEVYPVPCPHPAGAGVRDSETLCHVVGGMTCELAADVPRAHVIGLDTPFLGLAPHIAGCGAEVLLVPRSTGKLAEGRNDRIHWERNGLVAAVGQGGRIAAISQHMRMHLKHQFNVPAGAIIDLPNGLLLHGRPHEPESAPLPPPARAGFVLAMGRAVAGKGFDDLLSAVSLLRSEGVRLPHLVLAATSEARYPSPYHRRLHERAGELNLDATVLGRFSPVYRTWLRSPALRAVVVPSRVEPFGRIPLEAFSTGAGPVVATRVGGLMETVIDGETGFTAEPNNPADLADAIRRALLVTTRERDLLRRRGHALLTTRHDYGATIRSYVRDHVPWALEPVGTDRGRTR